MVTFTTEVVADTAELASRAAAFVAATARESVAARGVFTFAVSGGKTPWAMFAELAREAVPWAQIEIYQADERVAPDADPDRNLVNLMQALGPAPARVFPMPVTALDLQAAASSYSSTLPLTFDLIHLGIGPDGHTASLIPNDPVLDITDANVGVTAPYQGHQRMTFTFPVLDRAQHIMWLVAGADKAERLQQVYARDAAIPAARVQASQQIVFADRAAAGR